MIYEAIKKTMDESPPSNNPQRYFEELIKTFAPDQKKMRYVEVSHCRPETYTLVLYTALGLSYQAFPGSFPDVFSTGRKGGTMYTPAEARAWASAMDKTASWAKANAGSDFNFYNQLRS